MPAAGIFLRFLGLSPSLPRPEGDLWEPRSTGRTEPPSAPQSASERIAVARRTIARNRVCVADHSVRALLDDLDRILAGEGRT